MRCAVATLRANTRFVSSERVNQYPPLNHRLPRGFHSSTCRNHLHEVTGTDPRLEGLGKVIRDEYAVIREDYGESLPLVSGAYSYVSMHAKKLLLTTDSLVRYSKARHCPGPWASWV